MVCMKKIIPLCIALRLFSAPFVEAEIRGQLGNNLFIIATAYALAWDHEAEVYLPELSYKFDYNPQNVEPKLAHIFHHCQHPFIPPRQAAVTWDQPTFAYHPIPYQPDMKIKGFFQCEQYFIHQRQKILELFAPRQDDLELIQKKYKNILNHPCSVGIHLRWQWEDPSGKSFIQYGKDYLRKAAQKFPKEALFVVCSDNIHFARGQTPEEIKDRTIYIQKEPFYIDFFLLSLCKHNIITNSTFGWWAAWLNQNPKKQVIAPKQWYHPECPHITKDLLPKKWTIVDAKWGPLNAPETFQ